MAQRWHQSLAIFFSTALLLFLAACGGEDPVDNQNQNDQNQCDPETENCEEICDPFTDPDCECDPDVHDVCPEPENQTEGPCQTDDDCSGTTPYCYEGPSTSNCVSETFICSLVDCAGRPGVCDAANRECVNAEVCTATIDCLDDHLCVEGDCVLEDDACDPCTEFEICEYDRNTLTVECVNILCEPNSRECDGDTLLACNSEGTALQEIQCTEGCDDELGVCLDPQGESCALALEANDGDSIEIDWTLFANTYEPATGSSCITSDQTSQVTGADVTFQIEVPAGEVMIVEMRSAAAYGALYMYSSCDADGEFDSCESPTGYEEGPDGSHYLHTFWYHNDGADVETIFLTADSGPGATQNPATIDFHLLPRICDPDELICSAGTVDQCTATGTSVDEIHSCELGCADDDVNCAPLDHSSCEDALDLVAEGGSYAESIVNFLADDAPLDPSSCDDDDSTASSYEGATAYFAISLIAGERLTANLATTNLDGALSVRSGCGTDQCLAAADQGNPSQLIYQAEEAEDILLVVHAIDDEFNPDGTFALDINIDLPLCEEEDPATVLGCFDNLLAFCPATGEFPSFYGCDGDCVDGACETPSGDRCLDPIALGDGEQYSGSFAGQQHSLSNPGPTCLGSGTNAAGRDTIFEIEIEEPQQVLTASLSTPSSNVGMYLLDECPIFGPTTSACTASSFPGSSFVEYFPNPGTYYLVVSSTNANESSSFTLDISIDDGICLPGSTVCSDGITSLCNESGNDLDPIETCAGSCDGDICGGVGGANNLCDNALALNLSVGEPVVIRDSFDDYAGFLNFSPTTCDGDDQDLTGANSGPDAFYQLNLAALRGFRATLDTSANAAMVLLTGCSSGSCQKIHHLGTSGDTLEYYAPQGGTYYLGVKAVGSSSADFEMDVELFTGECDPAVDNACDGETARACSDLGVLVETECSFGCEDGFCLDRPGDFCHRPFDIDADGTDHGTHLTFNDTQRSLAGYTNAYQPTTAGGESCTGWRGDGPEVVYGFQGWRDDVMEITVHSDYDAAIWITTDCGNAAAQCVEGQDATFGPGQEHLIFTVEETRPHFLMVDAVQAGATGSFDLSVEITFGPRQAEPELEIAGADDLSWTLGVTQSVQETLLFTNVGDFDLEFGVSSAASWLEITPETGSIPGSESLEIDLVATCPAEDGTYTTNIVVTTNDPVTPQVSIPVELECEPVPGNMLVSVEGLPSGVNHLVLYTPTGEFNLSTLPQNGLVAGLLPGSYTLLPQEITHEGVIYNAPSKTIEILTDSTTTATIEYEATPGSLFVEVDGLPSGVNHDIDVIDSEGTAFVLPQSGLLSDLEPGDYTIVPRNVSADGEFFSGSSVNASITSGEVTQTTVTYEEVTPATVTIDAAGLPAGVDPEIDFLHDDGSVTSLPASGEVQLFPGNYTAQVQPISVDDHLYDADDFSFSVSAGDEEEFTVTYESIPGSLEVTIEGLGEGLSATITVTGPDDFDETLPASGELSDLEPGEYLLTPEPVEDGDDTYLAEPVTVSVVGGEAAEATVTYELDEEDDDD